MCLDNNNHDNNSIAFRFCKQYHHSEIEMVQIELIPDLTHCVETTARKEYQNLARSYLQEGKGDAEFQEKIELLRSFLETADFRKLRQESEAYLLKGEKVKFILYRDGGETKYRLTTD